MPGQVIGWRSRPRQGRLARYGDLDAELQEWEDISCGRLILHCNCGTGFCSSGLILCMKRSPSVVLGVRYYFSNLVRFALELFDVNYQELVKLDEKHTAENVLGAWTAFMQLHLECSVFKTGWMFSAMYEAEMMRLYRTAAVFLYQIHI